MNQRQLIHDYNDKFRPKFNRSLFVRHDEDIINALKHIIYSIERDSAFTIKVLDFEVITSYDDVNHILWEYEDFIINKGKKPAENTKKKSYGKKKKVNVYEYINLNDSDINLIKVKYFIQIVEKKDGLVNDEITVYIAIPKIVDDFYFKLNGKYYSAMYQIVDASTYNNSASRNSKKHSITFKTVFTPIRVYRYTTQLKDVHGYAIPCTYFVINVFRKSVLLIKYLLAKFGYYECMNFLHISGVNIANSTDHIDMEQNYVFPIREYFIVAPKYLYDNIQIMQSFVYTIYTIINFMKDAEYGELFGTDLYIKALGADFTNKNIDSIYDKGLSILESLEFNYDDVTKEDLKLDPEDKDDIYRILRWMIYEFNALRQKDNLDISTKKVRYAEYIASLYANRLATGIYRISDKGDKADLDTIKKAIQIPPMYLINAIIKCNLVSYKSCVNDLDALIALKYTYKGIAGIGEKSNAVSEAYRSIQPSHLGRVDIDSSSNSDPGVSGTICPYAELHDGHFDRYKEPSSWRDDITKLIDTYKAIDSRLVMCKIIDDHNLSTTRKTNDVLRECVSLAKSLLDMPKYVVETEEYINGIDLFGDGLMFYLNE
jgi:hypothetical protein